MKWNGVELFLCESHMVAHGRARGMIDWFGNWFCVSAQCAISEENETKKQIRLKHMIGSSFRCDDQFFFIVTVACEK